MTEIKNTIETENINNDINEKYTFKDFVLYFIIPMIIMIFILNVIIIPSSVSGRSMNPTLNNHDFICATKLKEVKRYDVCFIYSDKAQEKIVKRIYGLPNETVTIKGNDIYINGELIPDKYGYYDDEEYQMSCDEVTWHLGEDEYFVLGDNRCHSSDSRFTDIGKISKKNIRGVYLFKNFFQKIK